jgi:hypothetical protein
MNKYKILSFIIIIAISSCSPDDKKTNRNEFSVKTNNINIKTDTLANYIYDVFTIKYTEDLVLITYNNSTHSIEFFNLNTKKLEKRLFLKHDGPKAIGSIKGLYYHNKDSIFVYTRGTINIINESYNKASNPNLFTLIENYNLNFEPIVNNHFRLYYIPEIRSLTLFNIYYEPKDKSSPITEQISFFDINDFKIKTLPYFQTEPSESHFEYGHLNYSTISKPINGAFLINQLYSPITYQYNVKKSNLKKVISTDSIYHKKNRNPDNWVPHAVESNFFNQLEKLNDSTYIRIIWNDLEYEPKENGFLSKEYTLKIYDKHFHLIDEINLPKNTYYPYSWFVAKNKIYLQAGHPLFEKISEEEFIIHEIELIEK